MGRYRKKPVVVEAVTALDLIRAKTHDDFSNIPEWAIEAHQEGVLEIYSITVGVVTPEGEMTGDIGDWVIQGVKGELYPCKPDIFAATYEEVR